MQKLTVKDTEINMNNSIVAIFLQKAQYQMRETVDLVTTVASPESIVRTGAEIKEKYKYLLEGNDDVE